MKDTKGFLNNIYQTAFGEKVNSSQRKKVLKKINKELQSSIKLLNKLDYVIEENKEYIHSKQELIEVRSEKVSNSKKIIGTVKREAKRLVNEVQEVGLIKSELDYSTMSYIDTSLKIEELNNQYNSLKNLSSIPVSMLEALDKEAHKLKEDINKLYKEIGQSLPVKQEVKKNLKKHPNL
ncbi:MAG: hypothetical protein ACK4OM_06170 [Alphaproteobacteria bacterium]